MAILNDEAVVVGGVDGFIYILDHKEFTDMTKRRNKYMIEPGAPLGSSMMHCAPGSNTVLVQDGNKMLSTVYIPPLEPDSLLSQVQHLNSGSLIQFFESPKLMHQFTRMSRGGWGITASSISHNGRFISYSCLDSLYLIKLPQYSSSEDDDTTANSEPQRIDLYREYKMVPGYHVAFGMDNRLLVVISRDNVLQVFSLETMSLVFNMPLYDQSIMEMFVDDQHESKRQSCFSKTAVHSMDVNPHNGLITIAQGESVLVFDLAPVVSGKLEQHPSYSKPTWSFKVESNTNLVDTGLEAIMYKVKFFNETQFYVLLTGNVGMLADVSKRDHSFFGDMRTGFPQTLQFQGPFHSIIPLLEPSAENGSANNKVERFSTLYLANNESLFTFNGKNIAQERNVSCFNVIGDCGGELYLACGARHVKDLTLRALMNVQTAHV